MATSSDHRMKIIRRQCNSRLIFPIFIVVCIFQRMNEVDQVLVIRVGQKLLVFSSAKQIDRVYTAVMSNKVQKMLVERRLRGRLWLWVES